MESVANIGGIPVYDDSVRNLMASRQSTRSVHDGALHNALEQQICNTCAHRLDRRVIVNGKWVDCNPDQTVKAYRVYDDGCHVPAGFDHEHRVRDDPYDPEPDPEKRRKIPISLLATRHTCGWEPRQWDWTGCEQCIHFVSLNHSEMVGGRFPRSPMYRFFQVAGYCDLPPEGIDLVQYDHEGLPQAKRMHCAYQQLPQLQRDEKSCDTCAFCVRVASENWPGANGTGLGIMGNSVVRTGVDKIDQAVARLDHVNERQAGLDAEPVGYRLNRKNKALAAEERGFYTAFPAEIIDTTPGHIKLHFPQTSGDVELELMNDEATHWYGFGKKIRVPPGHIEVTTVAGKPNLAVVQMRLEPWREWFGIPIPGIRIREFPPRTSPTGYLSSPDYPERAVPEHCPRCTLRRACDTHARGLYWDSLPVDASGGVWRYQYPDARDPREVPASKEAQLHIEWLDNQLVVLDGYGKRPDPIVLRRAYRSLLDKARLDIYRQYGRDAHRLAAGAQMQLMKLWCRVIDDVPFRQNDFGEPLTLPPARFPLAVYDAHLFESVRPAQLKEELEHPFEPTFRKPRAIYQIRPQRVWQSTPGIPETGVYTCMAQLHGLHVDDGSTNGVTGIYLQQAMGVRNFGESQWDQQVQRKVSKRKHGLADDIDRTTFHHRDVEDFFHAMQIGARIQEAMDATNAAAGFYIPRHGTFAQPPAEYVVWRVPTRLDIDGDPTALWATGYDVVNDRADHVEWLDQTTPVMGINRSNRWRMTGTSNSALKARKSATGDESRWVQDIFEAEIDLSESAEEEEEIDLTDVEALNEIDDIYLVMEPSLDQEGAVLVETEVETGTVTTTGLDWGDAVHEVEDTTPTVWMELYCTHCQTYVGVEPVTDDEADHSPLECRRCGQRTVYYLGEALDDEERKPFLKDTVPEELRMPRRPAGVKCLQCGFHQDHWILRRGRDDCPVCQAALVSVDEGTNYRGAEKAKYVGIYRRDNDMIQRSQLERLGSDCPFWVARYSMRPSRGGRRDRGPINTIRLIEWEERNKERKTIIEER